MIACEKNKSALLLLLLLLAANAFVDATTNTAPPNIIIIQPDDFPMLEHWDPPNHAPGNFAQIVSIPASKLPNIEKIRTDGIQMMQAYTASPKCATSRYSTLTGRYPSRSSFSRQYNIQESISEVDVPTTKLQDSPDNDNNIYQGNDCSQNNIAALLQQQKEYGGYRTGFVGKWHLLNINEEEEPYCYNNVQRKLKSCGFDVADSIYVENLNGDWHTGNFSHNMEYMTSRAIDFMKKNTNHDHDTMTNNTSKQRQQPFFLYFNPTAPHSSGSVHDALTKFSCRNTPAGERDFTPYSVTVPVDGTNTKKTIMVDSMEDCSTYRQTILERTTDRDNVSLGTIWIDDAIGALIQTLKDINQYDNTFLLFQMDHGQEGKATLWEPGIRMAQFMKLPYQKEGGMKFHGMVSTIDIVPTILDFIGDKGTNHYKMDGISWKQQVLKQLQQQKENDEKDEEEAEAALAWNTNRCLFFEINQDRAVRCGCYKYMTLIERSVTSNRGRRRGYYAGGSEMVFDLCKDDEEEERRYDHDQQGINPETINVAETLLSSLDNSHVVVVDTLMANLDCHLEKTLPSKPPVYATCGPDTLSLLESSNSAADETEDNETDEDTESNAPAIKEPFEDDPFPELFEPRCYERRSSCRPRRGHKCCDGLVCRRGRYGGGRFKCRPPLY